MAGPSKANARIEAWCRGDDSVLAAGVDLCKIGPMRNSRWIGTLAVAGILLVGSLEARVFTDDQGRTTEAELAGVYGDDVVLRREGVAMRWPVARLSAADQEYVRGWQTHPPETPRISVRMWQREGLSPEGTFTDEAAAHPGLPDIPGVIEVEKRATYHHYDVDLTHQGSQQAPAVVMSYQLYVLTASGEVVTEVGSAAVPTLEPGKRSTLSTKAVSSTRTKTSSLRLSAGAFGGVSTRQKTQRSQEKFGGGWVRAYAHDGTLVGEAMDLDPEIERMKPAWIAPVRIEAPLLEGGLDGFDTFVRQVKERMTKIQEVLGGLAPPPDPDQPGPPGKLPPGPPPFPR